MMPLIVAPVGEDVTVEKVGGSTETRRFLKILGFVIGSKI